MKCVVTELEHLLSLCSRAQQLERAIDPRNANEGVPVIEL